MLSGCMVNAKTWAAPVVLLLSGLGDVGAQPPQATGKASSTPPESAPAIMSAKFHQDLRGVDVPNANLKCLGTRITPEAGGARIRLRRGQGPGGDGLSFAFKIQGDFDITVAYEILECERPDKGYGVGVNLYAALSPDTNDAVSLARRIMTDGNTAFLSDRMLPLNGKLTHVTKTRKASDPKGKLRLQRVGSRLRFYVADGAEASFTLLDDVAFGSGEVRYVSFGGNTGNGDAALDMRLLDLSVGAEKLPGLVNSDTRTDGQQAVPNEAAEKPPAREWLMAIGIVLAIVLLTGAVVGLVIAQRRRRA